MSCEIVNVNDVIGYIGGGITDAAVISQLKLATDGINSFIHEWTCNDFCVDYKEFKFKYKPGKSCYRIPSLNAQLDDTAETWVKIDGVEQDKEEWERECRGQFCKCEDDCCPTQYACCSEKCKKIVFRVKVGYEEIPACIKLGALEYIGRAFAQAIALQQATASFTGNSASANESCSVTVGKISKSRSTGSSSGTSSGGGGLSWQWCPCTEDNIRALSPGLFHCMKKYRVLKFKC